jgi:hypothetical protein
MKLTGPKVHRKSQSFKVGWVHGFYDCVNDDGARWDVCNQFLPPGTGTPYGETEMRQYAQGYHAGRAARMFRLA